MKERILREGGGFLTGLCNIAAGYGAAMGELEAEGLVQYSHTERLTLTLPGDERYVYVVTDKGRRSQAMLVD